MRRELQSFPECGSCSDYDAVLERTEAALSLFFSNGRPVDEPPGSLLAELAPLPRAAGALASRPRGSLPMLVRWLVVRSYAARFEQPEKMMEWALMARLAAESCTPAEAGSALRRADLQARAWAQLGGSFRIKGLLRSSEEALTTAERCAQRGTGDPALRSWILGARACLQSEKGDFAAAVELARKAGRISGAIDDFEEQANRIVTEANAWNLAGDPEQGMVLLEEAMARPAFAGNSEWMFFARYNLIDCCIYAGRADKALHLLMPGSPQPSAAPNTRIFLRSLWQHGELLALLGHLEAAESALRRAHRGFLGMALPREAVNLCRRLVEVNREMGQRDRADQIVTQSLAALERHAEPELIAALRELGDAP